MKEQKKGIEYSANEDTILLDRKEKYNNEKRFERYKEEYYRDIVSLRMKSAESTKIHYHKDVDESRVKSTESSRLSQESQVKALKYVIMKM